MNNGKDGDGQHHNDPPPQKFEIDEEGKCYDCKSETEEIDIITCYECDKYFHVKCSTAASETKICTPTFLKEWKKMIATKCNFTWICDLCVTKREISNTMSTNEKLTSVENKLETKVQELENKLTTMCDDISFVKDLLVENNPPASNTDKSITNSNPWADTNRVKKLITNKAALVIKKGDNNKCPDLKALEKQVIAEKINVTQTYINRSGDTVIECSSADDRNAVKQLAEKEIVGHKFECSSERRPLITVVGFKQQYEPGDLRDILLYRNSFVSMLCNSGNINEMLEVVVVKPCMKDTSTFQAIIKVNTSLRDIIHKHGDRLLIGLYSCRVYDKFTAKRCNRCQEFGHWMRDCKKQFVCAYCTGNHETKVCNHSTANAEINISCINCKRASKSNYKSHRADSVTCPCYREEQEKVRQQALSKRIPLN